MHLVTKTYWGPNPFSSRACVVFRFGTLAPTEASTLMGSHAEVSNYLSSRYGYAPPPKPQEAVTGLAAVLDFLATASLFILNHARGDLDASGYRTADASPVLYVEFHDPELTLQAVKLLLRMSLQFNAAKTATFDATLNRFWDQCQAKHPDFQAHTLITAAKSRRIHFASLGKRVWLYGMGAHSKTFFETSTMEDRTGGSKTDKLSGKEVFRVVGAPTAPYRIVLTRSELLGAVAEIGFPCAIKPIRAGAGRGVTANIKSPEQVAFAYAEAAKFTKVGDGIMVEEHVPGRDYRLLFVRGEFVACASSVAPFVTGDGVRSIGALVDEVNAGRTRSLSRSAYLRPIKVDDSVRETLSVQGLGLHSVLPIGTIISLRRNTNLGGGGTSQLFATVHPDVLAAAQRIARHSELHSVGIDYITEDIAASPAVSCGKFTELNKVPGVPLLLAAGFDIVKLGGRFLGEDTRNVEVKLYVLRPEQLEKFKSSYRGDCALFLPNTVAKGGTFRRFESSHFKPLLTMVLAYKSLDALDIVATPDFLDEHGFPTEHLSEVIVGASCMTRAIAETLAMLACKVRHV